MEVDSASTYAISDPSLTISHTVANYENRLALFGGSGSYYFRGVTDTMTPTQSSDFSFFVNYVDACRSSTIDTQVITLTAEKYDISGIQRVPAFKDSIDTAGVYATGICGEKQIILDASAPAFLSIVPDRNNPETSPFSIAYDHTKAIESDIKTHTVAYTVVSR